MKTRTVTFKESGMFLLPPRPDVCQECAVNHKPDEPHNRDSLYYQMQFQIKHGRGATWDDAIAHCTPEVKAEWILAVSERKRYDGTAVVTEEEILSAGEPVHCPGCGHTVFRRVAEVHPDIYNCAKCGQPIVVEREAAS